MPFRQAQGPEPVEGLRIKGSQEYPDAYWNTPFFRSERFLGAAWKAMPADLSQPRLGTRVLDLFDDMANAGLRKYALAEADMFRMETDYESYAHMNVNYVKLAERPRFADGWAPLLEALREGNFFSSTGEVLIPRFTANGVAGGGTLDIADGRELTVEADLEWTFPLAFAEFIWGDGNSVHRHRVEMSDTEAFGEKTLRLPIALANATWIRFEAWDLARNGAFTPPIWLQRP